MYLSFPLPFLPSLLFFLSSFPSFSSKKCFLFFPEEHLIISKGNISWMGLGTKMATSWCSLGGIVSAQDLPSTHCFCCFRQRVQRGSPTLSLMLCLWNHDIFYRKHLVILRTGGRTICTFLSVFGWGTLSAKRTVLGLKALAHAGGPSAALWKLVDSTRRNWDRSMSLKMHRHLSS